MIYIYIYKYHTPPLPLSALRRTIFSSSFGQQSCLHSEAQKMELAAKSNHKAKEFEARSIVKKSCAQHPGGPVGGLEVDCGHTVMGD